MAEEFRRHDFFLGRRNCQQFLRHYFALPIGNPLFGQWPDEMKEAMKFTSDDGVEKLPIVPLVDGVDKEIQQPLWAQMSQEKLKILNKRIYKRVKSLFQKSNAAPNRPLWIPAFAGITRF